MPGLVTPRDTVVTYSPPQGVKVNLSTTEHVVIADVGHEDNFDNRNRINDINKLSDKSKIHSFKCKVETASLPEKSISESPILDSKHSKSLGSLATVRHAPTTTTISTSNTTSVINLARTALTRASSMKSIHGILKNSSNNFNRAASLVRQETAKNVNRANSLIALESKRPSLSNGSTFDTAIDVPYDELDDQISNYSDEDNVFQYINNSILTDKSSTRSHQFPNEIYHHRKHNRVTINEPIRPNYKSTKTKNVSFDNEARTQIYEADFDESEVDDEREKIRLLYQQMERNYHIPMAYGEVNDFYPPSKEEEDLLPKFLCFGLAILITGGFVYILNLVVSKLNVNLFSS